MYRVMRHYVLCEFLPWLCYYPQRRAVAWIGNRKRLSTIKPCSWDFVMLLRCLWALDIVWSLDLRESCLVCSLGLGQNFSNPAGFPNTDSLHGYASLTVLWNLNYLGFFYLKIIYKTRPLEGEKAIIRNSFQHIYNACLITTDISLPNLSKNPIMSTFTIDQESSTSNMIHMQSSGMAKTAPPAPWYCVSGILFLSFIYVF